MVDFCDIGLIWSPFRQPRVAPRRRAAKSSATSHVKSAAGETAGGRRRHSQDDCDDLEVYDVHYTPPAGHLGRVWFTLEYENETEKLLVTLVRARHLPCRSRAHANSCDPFARLAFVISISLSISFPERRFRGSLFYY